MIGVDTLDKVVRGDLFVKKLSVPVCVHVCARMSVYLKGRVKDVILVSFGLFVS